MATTECPDCESGYDSERALKIHYRRSHGSTDYPWRSEERMVTCEQCSAEFEVPPSRLGSARFCSVSCRESAYSDGKTDLPAGGAGGTGDRCPKCGERFDTKHGLRVHWGRSHDDLPPWEDTANGPECPECDYTAADGRGLKIHLSKIHAIRGEFFGKNPASYQGGWDKARRDQIERDGYCCQDCGMSDDEHRAEYDRGLEVHHIEPYQSFDDPSAANASGNLVTLCAACHGRRHAEAK